MRDAWSSPVLMMAVAVGIAVAMSPRTHGQRQAAWGGVLDEHPSIQYAVRPTSDRAARLNQELTTGGRSLKRDPQTGYLRSLLDALDIPAESQLLVFSKTGVQSAHTSPRTPRALYFDPSVLVGYIPGAPAIELAAHDPQQGMVFYTLDQAAETPVLARKTSCLSCHVSSTTLNVPGVIARSNFVGDDGKVMPWLGSHDVTHQTSHTDRWGGWYVTADGAPPPYAQRAHLGNITFAGQGNTSNHVFVEWLDSAPETRGYLSSSSDIVSLLLFDHQAHAINLMTRLNWESRVAMSNGEGSVVDGEVRRLARELAEYLLFVGEAPPAATLTARPGFAERLASRTPKDRQDRSCGQLDLVNRLLRYQCSYLVYSEAFDALPPAVKEAVYNRMIEVLSSTNTPVTRPRLSTDDRRAVLEILRDTKSGFPAQ